MIKSAENLHLSKRNLGLFDSLMNFWGNFSLQSKAYSKRRATAVPNSNEFDPAVARLYHDSGFKRRI